MITLNLPAKKTETYKIDKTSRDLPLGHDFNANLTARRRTFRDRTKYTRKNRGPIKLCD